MDEHNNTGTTPDTGSGPVWQFKPVTAPQSAEIEAAIEIENWLHNINPDTTYVSQVTVFKTTNGEYEGWALYHAIRS